MEKDSNGNVPGFEDVDDEVASGNDMVRSHLRLIGHVSDEMAREEVEESSCNRLNLNFDKGCEQSGVIKDNNIYSASRTMTASFSQNGYSEEIAKIYEHLHQLGNGLAQHKPQLIKQTSTGVKAGLMFQDNVLEPRALHKTLEIGREQRESDSLTNQHTSDAPLGFEHITIPQASASPLPQLNSQVQDSETMHPRVLRL